MSRAALEGVAAIKSAVDSGATVYADTLAYRVIKDAIGQYLIHCTVNDSYIGLHGLEGTKYAETLNGSAFFTVEGSK
jgi:hypothetical protein